MVCALLYDLYRTINYRLCLNFRKLHNLNLDSKLITPRNSRNKFVQTCSRRGSRPRIRACTCKKRRCRQSRSGGSMQVAYGDPHTFTTTVHAQAILKLKRERERGKHLHIYIRKKFLAILAQHIAGGLLSKSLLSAVIKFLMNLWKYSDTRNIIRI